MTGFADIPNGFDELRIIAQDEKRLCVQDRETLNRCADEWELHQRQMIIILNQLIETNGRCVAQNERINELTRKNVDFPQISAQIVARLQWSPPQSPCL